MSNSYTDVLQTIKTLSDIDEKTLVQRALKTAEEVGEMAKCVLPFENSFATTHRFIVHDKILEEAVDTVLCAMSVAYKLGYSDEDISDMMVQKCVKWSKLQQASIKGRFPIPFEIHVTVRIPSQDWIEPFRNRCKELGVKPIVLELKEDLQDVMTSSIIVTDNVGAYNELIRIAQHLRDFGYNVVREKIETVPWHPAAPQQFMDDHNPNRYFESHINIVVNEDERNKLLEWNKIGNIEGHFSRNLFKKLNDVDFVQMLTIRSSTVKSRQIDDAERFTQYINDVITELNLLPFLRGNVVLKHTIEYAIYDTNIAHDTSWITKGE